MTAPATTVEELGHAWNEFREELERKTQGLSEDHDKVERLQTFFNEYEDKVNQPLTRAIAEAKQHKADIDELKEKLGAAGATETEQKARIDALELSFSHRNKSADESYRDSEEYKALNTYCRNPEFLEPEQKALLRTDINADGGFLVPEEMDAEITKKITEIDPIRSVARVRTTGGKTLNIPIRNTIPTATYEGEAETGTDSTSAYESVQVTPFRQTFTTPVTWDQLMDSAFDMDAEITTDSGEAFAFGEGNGFAVGTGFKQPDGIFANAILQAATRTTAASGVLDPEAIILLTGDLKVGYDPVYIMHRSTLALIRTFRADATTAGDAASAFLWAPGLNGPVANTLNGFPYILGPSVPEVAASAFAMAFGDFRRGYTIVDRTGLSIIRDEFTLKKKGIVEFTMNRWNTGQVTLTEAIKLLKIKA